MAVIQFSGGSRFGSPGTPDFPSGAKAITKTDTDTFERPVSIYVGAAGNVCVVPEFGDTTVTFVGMPAGSTLPVRVLAVRATNTTASSFVAIY